MNDTIRTPILVAGALLIALVVASLFHSLTQDTAPLSSSIETVLQRSPLEDHSRGFLIVHVDGPCDGACGVVQKAALGLLFMGIPLAVIAVILGRQMHDPAWNRKWGSFFQAGFVLNLGALLFLLPLLALFAIADPLMSGAITRKGVTAFLIADFLCCAFALRAWRRLMSL
jgi:hypothetical protein